jgi:hypothetical protein
MGDHLSRETYLALKDRSFSINLEGGATIKLRLAEVSDPRPSKAGDWFSLIFVTEPLDGAEAGLFALEHAEMGNFELFLVPIGRTPDGGFELEAVFSPPQL